MSLGQEQADFFLTIGNIQHPTSNSEHPMGHRFNDLFLIRFWEFDVQCSMLFLTKTISPCPAFRSSRDKWGMGVRQALFPMPTLGAPLSEAVSFPTPFSTASGVFGLVAGPSSALRTLDFE
jgi:hypothetical protein